MAFGERLRRFLDGPRPWRWAALVAVILYLPTLAGGFVADDHLLATSLGEDPRFAHMHNAPWDGFHMWPEPDPGVVVDQGLGAWWSIPTMEARFFRPLSSLTHWVDFRAGAPAWLMHLENLLWYAAICALAAALYRRLLGGWAAGLAALIYAADWTHGTTVGWIANRNALCAGAFGFAALLLHARGRRGWAALALALALASGEAALGFGAYLLAHAVCLEDGPWVARLRSLAWYVPVGVGWLAVYVAGGFGVNASGLYLDPGADPVGFLVALPVHAILALASELGGPAPDSWVLLDPGQRAGMLGLGAAVLVLAAVVLVPLLRRDRTARFFALGALLAVVPVCATFPSSRLMLVPGFGLLALVARAIVSWRDRPPAWPAGRPARAAAATFAVLGVLSHVVLVPPLLAVTQAATGMVDKQTLALSAGLPAHDPELASQRVVVVNAPEFLFLLYVLPARAVRGETIPAGLTMLGPGIHDLEVERAAADTLIVRDPRGFWGEGFSTLARSLRVPMAAGYTLELPRATITATAVDARGVATELRYRSAVPLEDPSLRWMAWDGRTLVPFSLPPVGARITLPSRPHPLIFW